MLELAIKAQLPMIAVIAPDTVNFKVIVKHITGRDLESIDSVKGAPAEGRLYYTKKQLNEGVSGVDSLYKELVKAGSTLLLLNQKHVPPQAYDAGMMPVPKDLVLGFLKSVYPEGEMAENLLPSLGGLTVKEVAETVRMTEARDAKISPQGILVTRRSAFQGSKGLEQVETESMGYVPPKAVTDWLKREKEFFLHGDDYRLISKGLLFDGPPGTGKTAGAKYLASELGIPLFRLDMSDMMSKWQGESENRVNAALQQIDQEEPCVLLIDEVEKVFSTKTGDESSGTSSRILSTVLWWLQEHKTRVLVIMTCNNRGRIPPELLREGRLDQTLMFAGLASHDEALKFANWVAKMFQGVSIPVEKLEAEVAKIWDESMHGMIKRTVSQAQITNLVYRLIKETKLAPIEPVVKESKVTIIKKSKP